MREALAAQLDAIERRLEDALEQGARTLASIGTAVLSPTAETTGAIADHARQLRRSSRAIEADLVVLAARQSPVATDLRRLLALTHLAHHQALIANQFELISEQLTETDGNVIDRDGTAEKLATMTALAGSQLRDAMAAFAARDLDVARAIDRQDDAVDRLNREICGAAREHEATSDQRELALRHVLVARSLERIADNAVDIAEQAAFLITAELREFSDASHPKPRRPQT